MNDETTLPALEVEHLRQRAAQAEVLQSEVMALRRERDSMLAALSKAAATPRSAGSASTPRQAKESPAVRRLRKELSEVRNEVRRLRRRNADLRQELVAVRGSRSFRAARVLSVSLRPWKRILGPAQPSHRPEGAVGGGDKVTKAPPPKKPQPGMDRDLQKSRTERDPATQGSDGGPDTLALQSSEGATPTAILLDGRGATRDALASAVAQLADIAGRVVVVLDSPDFDIPRRYGMPIEYVPDLAWLEERAGGPAASSVLESRWNEILSTHRPTEIYKPKSATEPGSVPTMTWFAEEALA